MKLNTHHTFIKVPSLLFILSLLTLICLTSWSAENKQLNPIDQSNLDSSFSKFKRELMKAIDSRDLIFLQNILSDDVIYTFGSGSDSKNTKEGFLRFYKLKENKESLSFWREFKLIIELGCTTHSNDSFVCPYVYSEFPDSLDSYSYVVVVKKRTFIRQKPTISAPELKSVNFDILKLSSEQKSRDWYAVELDNNKIGYILKSAVRSPISYRVEFKRTLTGWKLKYFIAGD